MLGLLLARFYWPWRMLAALGFSIDASTPLREVPCGDHCGNCERAVHREVAGPTAYRVHR